MCSPANITYLLYLIELSATQQLLHHHIDSCCIRFCSHIPFRKNMGSSAPKGSGNTRRDAATYEQQE